jgi:hypothetical protein
MALSFALGLGFFLLVLLLTGILLIGRNPEARRLFIGIVLGFAGLVLALLAVAQS